MILIIHIVSALSSLAFAAAAFLFPSKTKLNITYVLVGTMLITGFYLVFTQPAHLTQTCAEGLVYLVVVSYGIVTARHKLISMQTKATSNI